MTLSTFSVSPGERVLTGPRTACGTRSGVALPGRTQQCQGVLVDPLLPVLGAITVMVA